MEKLPPVIHVFQSFDAASGHITTMEGVHLQMIRLMFGLDRQGSSGRQAVRLPDVWATPSDAAALAVAIQTALWRYYPDQAQALGVPRGTPPGSAHLSS